MSSISNRVSVALSGALFVVAALSIVQGECRFVIRTANYIEPALDPF